MAQSSFARRASWRSKVRAWMVYAGLMYVSVSVAVVGITIEKLAPHVHAAHGVQLRSIFLGRGVGAVLGTCIGGVLIDRYPLKWVMGLFMALSAAMLLLVPVCTSLASLSAVFALLGVGGSGTVCCTTTAACWAFPGDAVGPVLSRAGGAFGLAAAMLPAVLYPFEQSVARQYICVASCSLPALALLAYSSAIHRPSPAGAGATPAQVAKGASSCLPGGRDGLLRAVGVALVQVLLQGNLSSLMSWLVTFVTMTDASVTHGAAVLRISVLQTAITMGCFAAAQYQQLCSLVAVACVHLALAGAGLLGWLLLLDQSRALLAVIGWVGFFAGPSVGFASSIYNQRPVSGIGMAVVNLGINTGANCMPWLVGWLMELYGPVALPATVAIANASALASLALVGAIVLGPGRRAAACPRGGWGPHGDGADGPSDEALLPERPHEADASGAGAPQLDGARPDLPRPSRQPTGGRV